MNNVFTNDIISEIEEQSLESEIAVLESILISLESCDYIAEHASDADITNDSFRLIMEGFVMEADDNAKNDGEGNVIQRFFKKISQLISGIFKKNPGKVEYSEADKKKLSENVKKAKKGGPVSFVKKHKLLSGMTVVAAVNGIRLMKTKSEINDINKEGKTKIEKLKEFGNTGIEITDTGDVKFIFSMDLKEFAKNINDAKGIFASHVSTIMKLRSDWNTGQKTGFMNNFSKDFRKHYFDTTTKAIEAIGKPFRTLFASYGEDKEYVLTTDEWDTFVEGVNKDCVEIAENLDRLSDWMPSTNHSTTLTEKNDRVTDDFKKANPRRPDEDAAAYEARITMMVRKTHGTFKTNELDSYKSKMKAAMNKLRNDMSDIHNDYIGMASFFKDVKSKADALKEEHDAQVAQQAADPANP